MIIPDSVPDKPDAPGKSILVLDNVSVSFDGFRALNGLSFVVMSGQMRAVIGPNGAGKTTMMDVITGKTRPDSGRVIFRDAHDLTVLDEARIANLGIGRKFQKPTVFENLTVFDNLWLAFKGDRRVRRMFSFFASRSWRRLGPSVSPRSVTSWQVRSVMARSNGSKLVCSSCRTRICC